MKVREDIIYFLKHGKLENINFGITKAQLIEVLGEPDYVSERKSVNRCDYGRLEFYFLKEECRNHRAERLNLLLASNPFSYETKGNLDFSHQGWTTDLTIGKAIEFLGKNDIAFEEEIIDDEHDTRILKTEGSVSINFRDWNETGDFVLCKFGRAVELNPIKPPTKQISFEIEESFYSELKKKAEETGVSIAALCREIIEQNLTPKG